MWQGIKNSIHLVQAAIANISYGFPARGLTIIGVTGTDGKTTTASLIYHILKSSGKKTALITSIAAVIDGKTSDSGFHVTTPNSFATQSYLRMAKNAGVTHVVLEVSSHGLDQHRVAGVPFAVGVLTNITHEHLDYHKTYARYVAAKAKLLRKAKIAIVNKDDRSYFKIKDRRLKIKEKGMITYGFKKDSDVNPHNFPFQTKLFGQFNKYNCLAAIAVCRALRIHDEQIRKAVASFKAPEGREEIVYDKAFKIIIDFAHTPNAFQQLLSEVRKATSGKLIHVFGAAAKRDTYKRPQMGKISSQYSDIIILTAEDPRNEPVEEIFTDISVGIPEAKFKAESAQTKQITSLEKHKNFLFKIPDRKEAIVFAVSLAHKGDIVLITGKGHEKSMNYGKGEEPWNEHEVVREALKRKG